MVLSAARTGGWRGRWIAWRNRLLASPDFQRFAARFPLTRPVARARARGLFDLVAGFTYSQILSACVETGLLDLLASAPHDIEGIAALTNLPPASADRLLRAAAALDLVEHAGDAWMLGQAGAALRGNPGIAEMVAHHRLLYADLADPVALLARGGGGGQLAALWRYGDAAAADDYSRLMAASQPLVAEQVIDAYPFARHRRLLDVGGGEGVFLDAVGRRAPEIGRALFDLPAVGERARARLGGGIEIFAGDFLRDPLPTGFDAISLVRVLHDHDDGPALELLRSIRAALAPRGTLIVAEPMAETPGAPRMGDAYFGLYLLAMGSGRPRSSREIAAMLRVAGFRTITQRRTSLPLTVSVISAT